jgi:hypothetical protein
MTKRAAGRLLPLPMLLLSFQGQVFLWLTPADAGEIDRKVVSTEKFVKDTGIGQLTLP